MNQGEKNASSDQHIMTEVMLCDLGGVKGLVVLGGLSCHIRSPATLRLPMLEKLCVCRCLGRQFQLKPKPIASIDCQPGECALVDTP